jgi:hypothetical protein
MPGIVRAPHKKLAIIGVYTEKAYYLGRDR